MVGREPHPLVERQGAGVVAQHLEVGRGRPALGAPLQQLGHDQQREARPRSAGSTSMLRKPTQSSAYAATPGPQPRRRCASAVTRWSSPSRRRNRREVHREGTPCGRPRRSRTGCPRRGSRGPSRARGTTRPPPSPAAPPRSAAGPVRVERQHPLVVVGDAGRTHREHRVGPPRGRGRGVPQEPVAERHGLEVRPEREGAALRLPRYPVPGRRRAGPACRRRCRRWG